MNILDTNWYLVFTLSVMLIIFIIDWRRLRKENILLMANPDTIIGVGIINAIQTKEDLNVIINQVRQMHQDDSRQIANVYGDAYEDLKRIIA